MFLRPGGVQRSVQRKTGVRTKSMRWLLMSRATRASSTTSGSAASILATRIAALRRGVRIRVIAALAI